jgi:hypothetical protein
MLRCAALLRGRVPLDGEAARRKRASKLRPPYHPQTASIHPLFLRQAALLTNVVFSTAHDMRLGTCFVFDFVYSSLPLNLGPLPRLLLHLCSSICALQPPPLAFLVLPHLLSGLPSELWTWTILHSPHPVVSRRRPIARCLISISNVLTMPRNGHVRGASSATSATSATTNPVSLSQESPRATSATHPWPTNQRTLRIRALRSARRLEMPAPAPARTPPCGRRLSTRVARRPRLPLLLQACWDRPTQCSLCNPVQFLEYSPVSWLPMT